MVSLSALRECALEIWIETNGLDAGRARAHRRPASAAAEDLIDVVTVFGLGSEFVDQVVVDGPAAACRMSSAWLPSVLPEEVSVLGAHGHGVNGELDTFEGGDRHDLEETGVASWSDVEAGVVVGVVDSHRVGHGVLDVVVGDAVLARRRVDVEHEL